jgi:hypothetical protein
MKRRIKQVKPVLFGEARYMRPRFAPQYEWFHQRVLHKTVHNIQQNGARRWARHVQTANVRRQQSRVALRCDGVQYISMDQIVGGVQRVQHTHLFCNRGIYEATTVAKKPSSVIRCSPHVRLPYMIDILLVK